MKNKYLYHLLIALDQLANAIFAGAADETISSRCYRGAVKGKKKWVIAEKCVNALFFDKLHCKTAYESEIKRRQYPTEFQAI
ncbi:DNA helicase UvrD [Actinobacillus porcitonsillarum]|uniref:DNA helicase UvrD n=1 Tax=Actinobacillus porcitonsillarum TaxID=189834 RepID=A0A2U8FKA7_9PAST|nr:DNA helicase UvrD [Actinobacillus porcitonsillarum]AWI51419.1 DNA helicase UvrD [Actinobacillus porcitonsillarum]